MDKRKSSPGLRHRLALVVLCLAAGLHLVLLGKERAANPSLNLYYIAFVACLWALIIWKIWRRSWGRGVGVVMMVVGASTFHLWWKGTGICRGAGDVLGFVEALKYLPVEAAIVVAGFFCVLLPSTPPEMDDEATASGEVS